MCFRPPGAAKAIRCPRCNMFNPPTAKKCRKCGLTEEEAIEMFKAKQAASESPDGEQEQKS